jgi:hypothetical protein
MNKDITKRSHAQNKFLRRKDNRAGNHPAKGTPIPGQLTPTEIAHKARRRSRRLAKAKSASSLLPSRLEKLQSRLAHLESQEKPQDSKHLQALEHEITDTKLAISYTEKEISRASRILSALS